MDSCLELIRDVSGTEDVGEVDEIDDRALVVMDVFASSLFKDEGMGSELNSYLAHGPLRNFVFGFVYGLT